MNVETQSDFSGKAATAGGRRAAGWIKSLAFLVVGIVLGVTGWRVWNDIQASRRFHLARQTAEQMLHEITPQAEARLAAATHQLEALESDVTQASLATSAEAIDVSRLRLQQRRLGMQLDEIDRALHTVTSFIEQAPQRLALRPDRELLAADQQQTLADLAAQFDRSRRDYEALGSDIELARGRRLVLAAVDAETSRRAQTEAEAVQRVQAEALRVQAEALNRGSAEPTGEAPSDLSQLAYLAGLQSGTDQPFMRRFVPIQPIIAYPNASLVIGSSYPDRCIGYRTGWPCWYGGYGGYGYGPWRCGWGGGYGCWSGYSGYRWSPYRCSPYRCWW